MFKNNISQYPEGQWVRINVSTQYYEWHSRQEQYIKWNSSKVP